MDKIPRHSVFKLPPGCAIEGSNGAARIVPVDARHPVETLEPEYHQGFSERDAGRLEGISAVLLLLDAKSDRATVLRLRALKFLLHLENKSGSQIAAGFGVTRQTFDKHLRVLSKRLNLPSERWNSVERYRTKALAYWKKRKAEQPPRQGRARPSIGSLAKIASTKDAGVNSQAAQ